MIAVILQAALGADLFEIRPYPYDFSTRLWNLGGANVVLTGDDLARIDQTLAGIEVQRDRYPAFPPAFRPSLSSSQLCPPLEITHDSD